MFWRFTCDATRLTIDFRNFTPGGQGIENPALLVGSAAIDILFFNNAPTIHQAANWINMRGSDTVRGPSG